MCGYANTEGGTLYIGVNDDGYVVGIENSKRMLEGLPNKIRDKLGVIASSIVSSDTGALCNWFLYLNRYFSLVGTFGENTEPIEDLQYQDVVDGPLLLQVDKAIDLIFTKYFKALIDYEGIQRTETYMLTRGMGSFFKLKQNVKK